MSTEYYTEILYSQNLRSSPKFKPRSCPQWTSGPNRARNWKTSSYSKLEISIDFIWSHLILTCNQGSKAPPSKAGSTLYRPELYDRPENEVDFYDYINKRWAVFFSRPCDFTPVCTTEIVEFAKKQAEFNKRDTRLIGLSVGEIGDHIEWVGDIHSNILNDTPFRINFPIVADEHGDISRKYGM